MIKDVQISRQAEKDLKEVPRFILKKFKLWTDAIMEIGFEETQKSKGFHDEPLKGKRKGQRSIRLNRAYRAIYRIEHGIIKFIEILEVNKHEY